jgi:hypothetical protein
MIHTATTPSATANTLGRPLKWAVLFANRERHVTFRISISLLNALALFFHALTDPLAVGFLSEGQLLFQQ